MRKLALLALLASTGCSAALNWKQCDTDDQCAVTDLGPSYCTNDHICVNDVPSDRLCTVDPSSSSDPSAMTIGGLFRLSGANEEKDTAIAQAASLAVLQINGEGKRLVRLVLCDTNGSAAQARKAMTVAVEGFHAVAMVGPTSSGEVLGLAQLGSNLVEQLKVPVVSDSATSPAISSLGTTVHTPQDGDVSLIWRTCASDAVQARVLSSSTVNGYTLIPAGTTGVSVAYVKSAYGEGLSGAFASDLATTFPAIQPQSASFDEGTDGATVTSFLQMNRPQVALIIADSDAPTWIGALAGGGPNLSGTQYLLTDGAKSNALLMANPSSNLLGVYKRIKGTGPATPSGAAYAAFASKYKGTYSQDPADTAYTANMYDAVFAVVTASAVVAPGFEVTGTAIASGLARLSTQGSKTITVGVGNGDTFAQGYQELSQGNYINLIGTSGDIDFDSSTGDVLTAPIELWSIDTTTDPTKPTFHTDTVVAAP